jgi:arylsulfate sulfotransferase
MKSCSLKTSFMPACVLAAGISLSSSAMATPVVHLTASVPSPQKLGTAVTLTASATDMDAGTVSYRFEVGSANSMKLSIIRDYSVATTFAYALTLHEGEYQFEVVARNNKTQQTAIAAITPFQFTSLVSGPTPVVTTTANPLVALFSAPSCATGSLMRVNFARGGTNDIIHTNWQPCLTGASMNFLIAGMRVAALYNMQSQIVTGGASTYGPNLSFTTGTPSVTFTGISLPTPPTIQDSIAEQFLLLSNVEPSFPFAVDISGAPVWYYNDPNESVTPAVTKPLAGGGVLMIGDGPNSIGGTVPTDQVLREIDLAGNVIRETNASRVSEQVAALSGVPSSCQIGSTDCLVGGFHHEAVRLSSGHTLVLSDEEKIFTDGTQGSSRLHPVDIVGDIILDLDTNWQVAWYWRSFDHLDVNRAAILRETIPAGTTGHIPLFLTTGSANDWLHGNSLDRAVDGSIIFSIRNQDWIDKIDYSDGAGTGNVIWTLGSGGDFTINSSDPWPWFSHQHDAGFESGGTTILSLYDNGNTRVAPPPVGLGSGDSRGYVLSIDQTNMTATPILLADLGAYAFAIGSAQGLANGDYHFDNGVLDNPLPHNQSIEVFPTGMRGTLGFEFQLYGNWAYRSFRLVDFYSLPEKFATE